MVKITYGEIVAFELNWNTNRKTRIPQTFLTDYQVEKAFFISQGNTEEFYCK